LKGQIHVHNKKTRPKIKSDAPAAPDPIISDAVKKQVKLLQEQPNLDSLFFIGKYIHLGVSGTGFNESLHSMFSRKLSHTTTRSCYEIIEMNLGLMILNHNTM
jgi:hypothetical protein